MRSADTRDQSRDRTTTASGEEKPLFLGFLRKMLQWKSEDRSNMQDVFMDEWLLADLIESEDVVREQ